MKQAITKLLVLAVLLTAGCGAASAQFRFGIKAGANFNKAKFSEKNFESDNRAGFTAGVMTEFTVPVVGLCLDASLMYSRLYTQYNDQNAGAVTSLADAVTTDPTKPIKAGQSFFDVPINVKYKIMTPAASIIAPYIYTGPDFAFNLTGKNNVFQTKTFQFSWNVGIGVQLIKHLQVGAGYTFGINNIAKHVVDKYGVEVGDVKQRNNYWTVTAAWLF